MAKNDVAKRHRDGRVQMRHFYLDSNVVFRLGGDLVRILCDAQRARRFRLAIGQRVVLEMAGAYVKKPESIPKSRKEAEVLLAILESGGRLARDAMDVCREALKLSPTRRWNVVVLSENGSTWYDDGVATLQMIADGASHEQIRGWYRPHEEESIDYRAGEDRFYRAAQSLRDPGRSADFHSLRRVLDDLEEKGWLSQTTAACAKRFGFRKRVPSGVESDWFGPLGRAVRASTGLSALQIARHDGAKKQKRKPSDFADVNHIVVAGMVGDFVTQDATAKRVFNATWPMKSRKCLHFEREFLPWLRG